LRDLVALILAFVVAAGGFVVFKRLRFAKLREVRLRSQQNRRSFELAAISLGSAEIVSRVYEYFENLTPNQLPVLVEDKLDETYGIVGDDVFEEVSRVAKRCQLPMPSAADVLNVRTVGHVIGVLEALRAHEQTRTAD